MTLRLRILFGYGYLVILLLAATGSAMLGFFHLSAGIEEVLDKNYASIRASSDMFESLERQDSAVLAALLARQERPPRLDELEEQFLDALDRAAGNVTEEEEPGILTALEAGFEVYRRARGRLLESPSEATLLTYEREVSPPFAQLQADILRLLEVNQAAMYRAAREARQAASQNGVWLGLLVAVALVSMVLLARALQSGLLDRLEELRHDLEAAAGGETQRRLRDAGRDELASIARHANQLLDVSQKAAARSRASVALERQRVLALVKALGDGVGLYDLSGHFVAGSDETRRHHAVGRWISEDGSKRTAVGTDSEAAEEAPSEGASLDRRETLAVEDEELTLRLLHHRGRPVGWLVEPA